MNGRKQFITAVNANEKVFNVDLGAETIERLADYYEIVEQHNAILHLVAPCPPEEFATRHVLESLTLLKHLPPGARFADIGPGAGLPSLPCLIARDDVTAVLIESKERKTRFLETAASNLFAVGRVEVINSQFEEVREHDFQIVTCRALDKFVDKLPRLLKWAGGATMLLFGGTGLRDTLDKIRIEYQTEKMPLSEQRFLFVLKGRRTPQ